MNLLIVYKNHICFVIIILKKAFTELFGGITVPFEIIGYNKYLFRLIKKLLYYLFYFNQTHHFNI